MLNNYNFMNEEINKIEEAKKTGNVEALEEIKINAEVAMEWDIAKAAENAISEIANKVNETKTTDIETRQITENGGDISEIQNETAEVDAEIAQIQENRQKEIDVVTSVNPENTETVETKSAKQEFFDSALVSENGEVVPPANGEDLFVSETPKEEATETTKEKFDIMEGATENGKPIENETETQINTEELKNKITEIRQKMAEQISIDPKILDNLDNFEKIRLYKSLGKTEEANKLIEFLAEDYEFRSNSDQGSGFLASQAAEKYADLGNSQKAKEMWEKSIRQIRLSEDPKYSGNYFHAADVYEKLGDTEKSNEMYRKYIQLNQKAFRSDKSYSGLANAYEKLGDTENAKKMWEKEAEEWGQGAKAERAGEAYEKAGNKEKSEESYRIAITYQEDLQKRGSSNFDQKRLAKAYMGIGEKSKVIQMFKENAEEMENRGSTLGEYQNYELIDKYLNE